MLIAMIATAAHALAGNRGRAGFWASNVRQRNASLDRNDLATLTELSADSTGGAPELVFKGPIESRKIVEAPLIGNGRYR